MRGRRIRWTPPRELNPDDYDWLSVEAFKELSVVGWCLIKYKGRVVQAYHNDRGMFCFCKGESNAYMTEYITGVCKA
jgi:hypothetical protein